MVKETELHNCDSTTDTTNHFDCKESHENGTWYSITLIANTKGAPTSSNKGNIEIISEEDTFELFEIGIEGIIFNEDGSLTGYFPEPTIDNTGVQNILSNIVSALENKNFKILELKLVQDKNWVAECSTLLEPLVVDKIKINPITDSSRLSKDVIDSEGKIIIDLIPGFGFGTGHHETTKGCLEFIQNDRVKAIHPKKVLDVGTGSGILSIAISKLYGSTITATDIDNQALINAKENIEINNSYQNITLVNKAEDKDYELIVANIYAEVLVLLEDDFYNRLKPNGILILSGIIQPMLNMIENQFSVERWKLYETKCENNWVTRGYTQRS